MNLRRCELRASGLVTLLVSSVGCAGYSWHPELIASTTLPAVDTPLSHSTEKGDSKTETRADVAIHDDAEPNVSIRATNVTLCSTIDSTVVDRAVTTHRTGKEEGSRNAHLLGWVLGSAGVATLGTGLALGLGTPRATVAATPTSPAHPLAG